MTCECLARATFYFLIFSEILQFFWNDFVHNEWLVSSAYLVTQRMPSEWLVSNECVRERCRCCRSRRKCSGNTWCGRDMNTLVSRQSSDSTPTPLLASISFAWCHDLHIDRGSSIQHFGHSQNWLIVAINYPIFISSGTDFFLLKYFSLHITKMYERAWTHTHGVCILFLTPFCK